MSDGFVKKYKEKPCVYLIGPYKIHKKEKST